MADRLLRVTGRLRRGDLDLAVDLALPHGVIALVGPNGGGKTSVLRTVAGLDQLAEGELVIDGTVLDRPADARFVPPEERDVAMAFQEPRLFPHRSVLQNITYPLERHRRSTDAAAVMADRVGLGSLLDRRPRDLSGGQAQRVNLARAMVVGAGTLLLDEPLASIDDGSRDDLRARFRDTGSDRVLWVTHDPADAEHADVVVSIEGDRLGQTAP